MDARRVGLAGPDLLKDVQMRLPLERGPTGEQLIEDDAEGVSVGGRSDVVPLARAPACSGDM